MRCVHGLGGFALAAAIGFAPALPPEHIHERHDEAGHHQSVAHRHTAPHHFGHAETGAVFDDVDPVVVLDTHSIATPKVVVVPPAVAVGGITVPAPLDRRPVLVTVVADRVHGPPRAPTPLRGPPSAHTL